MPSWKKVITSGSNAHLNHITASGNISSSGHFIGTHKGVGSGVANKVFFEGDGGPAKLASANQSTTYLNFGQNSLGIVANNEDTFNVNDDGLVRVGTPGESHGTKALHVHGDISCSGNIHLEPGNLNQTVFVTTGSAGTDTIRFGIGTAKGEIPGTALTVSGSISSSGFVSASSFSGDGSGLTNVSATVSPAGSDTQVQFNDGGSLGGDSGLVYNKTSDTLTTTNIGAFNLTGKLTAGSTEIEGSAFDINGGVIDQTTIGGSTAAAGTFTLLTGTNITASGNISASGTGTNTFTDKLQLIHPVSGSVLHVGRDNGGKIVNTFAGNNVRNVFGGSSTNTGTVSVANNFYGSSAYSNFLAAFEADGEEVMKGGGTAAGGDLLFQFGDIGGVANEVIFKVDDGNSKFDFIGGTVNFGTNGTGNDVFFYGDTTDRYIQWDQSQDQLKFYDNTELVFGTGTAENQEDTRMVFDGSNFKIESSLSSGTTSEIQLIPNHKGVRISGSGDTYLDVEGHITASNNISASGNLIGNQLVIGGGTFTSASLAAGGGGGSGTVTSIVAGDGLNGGTITSTGTISVDSASMGGFYSASMNDFTTTGFIKGNHITASGNISASGDIFADDITADDLVTAGRIATTGDLTIDGSIVSTTNITASGDISSSGGNLYGNQIVLNGETIRTDGDFIDIPVSGLIVTKGIRAESHITASGNISSSGVGTFGSLDISGNIDVDGTTNLDVVDIDGDVSLAGDLDFETSAGRDITFGDNLGAALEFKEAGNLYMRFVTTNGSEGVTLNKGLTATSATFSNNITANGNIVGDGSTDIYGINNISASGTITSSGFNLIGTGTAELEVDGHITASGNISASGIITAEGLVISDDATITDDLTVSGQIELGHATDTSLTRASAGDVNIEGNIIYRAGGTDVPVTDGGTGVGTFTDGGVLLGNGTGAIQAMAVLTDGQMIVGDGTTDPVAESGATLRTSIGVGTTDNVQFAHITGSVISASSGIFTSVDIDGGSITGITDLAVADGGTGQSNLNNLITMGTHTTGNYVATITAGTGLTSDGATSGESIAHSLSVDASQTQITSVGTIGTGVWQGTKVASAYLDDDTAHLTTTQTFSGLKTFSSAITASGNISASGVITATRYDIGGGGKFAAAGDGAFDIGQVGAGSLNLTNITASGNISASGTITGNAINVNGTNVLVAGGVDISDDTNLAGGTGITLTGDTLSTTDSEIVHDNLSGFVANEHIDHSGVTMTAAAGLNGGGTIAATRTFSVDSASMGGFYSASMNDFTTTGFIKGNHITASGNISSSGTIIGNAINVNGTNVLVAGGVDISTDTNLAGGTGITLTGDTLSTTDGEIVHDSLSGFVGDEHIDHTSVTMTAGAGLTGGGTIAATRTFNIDSASMGGFYSASMNDFTTTGFIKGNHITASGNISASGGNLLLGGGTIDLKNTGTQSNIKLYCESSNAHYVKLQAPEHSEFSGNVTVTLPPTTDTLVGKTTTDTLTNKTLTSPDINTPDIDGGNIDNTVIGASTPAVGTFSILTGTNITASGNISGSITSTGSFANVHAGTITITHGADGTDRSGYSGNFYMTSNNIIKTDDTLHIAGALNVNNSKFIVNNSPTGNDVTVTGDMKVTSDITASANISSSGNLIGNELVIGGGTFTSASLAAGGGGGGGDVSLGDNVNFGNITASGDISASGKLYVTDDVDFDGTFKLGEFTDVSASLAAAVAGGDNLGNHTATANLKMAGFSIENANHITASGDISSSGAITTWCITIHGTQLTNRIDRVDNAKTGVFFGDGIHVGGHITASGDISGSSTSTLSLSGFHVSSSGNVMINSDNAGSMATHLGALSVNYGNDTQLTGSIGIVGDGYGDIVKIGGTTTIKGNMYYLDTDSTWTLTNATDDSAGADKLLAIALGTNSDIDGMLLKGFVHLNPAGTIVVGAALYMRAGTGATTFDKDTGTGNINRIVGYGLSLDGHVYFNPDSTWVEHS